ncbi:MAG: ribonuclease R [Firmicutes bacterium]|nr:ribonuclease R [Bacillota bacterium]
MEKVAGVLEIKQGGFGFVRIGKDRDDIFIKREDLNGAMHGDRVLVLETVRKGRHEGEVLEVLDRRIVNLVGTLMKSRTGYFIMPDNDKYGDSFDIVESDKRLRQENVGKKVVAKLNKSGGVTLDEILGEEDEFGVDVLSIIRAYNLYEEFPEEVEREAKKEASQDIELSLERRLDLREKNIITIDPADAKDLDDAIHLEKREDGMWELGVHIADVSHYVREDSLLDKEAYARATSVYFPDRVLPMLPSVLSNDVCSLNPSTDKLTLSAIIVIDPYGEVVENKVHESIINVKTKFSYEQVQGIIDGDAELVKKHKKIIPTIEEMVKLAKVIEKKRRARGEVVFDVPEPKIVLDDETGKIIDVVARKHEMSHRIIETFMILCNEVVAKKMYDLEMPFIFRTHEKPDPAKVDAFIETLKPFAVQHRIDSENASGHAYQNMLDSLGEEISPIISSLALRSMQKAKYSEKNIGHFGLGATHYCHFTSPIRRYPDLVIHRVIKLLINRKISSHKKEQLFDFCKDASVQSSRMEVQATEAEREVDNLKKAQYMSDKIGEKFTGTISGLRDFGVFVYLPNTVEGLVRIDNMPSDNYIFNEKQMTYVGRKRTYKMGDKLDIIVAGVNIPRRQVEFTAAF